MKKRIGINISFMTPAQRERLTRAAAECGAEPRFVPQDGTAAELARECEVLFGRFSRDELRSAARLEWHQSSSAGVDALLADGGCMPQGAVLTCSTGAFGVTMSEHLICYLLMLMRRVPEYNEGQAQRRWQQLYPLRSICGSTIVVVGLGDIGGQFARKARALGAHVIGVRRSGRPAPELADRVVTPDRLTEVLPLADAVAVALPATGETENMFSAEVLASVKEGAYFLNVGRGSAVDQEALLAALRSGRLAGAALDVFVPEPLPPEHPLWSAPNTLITPHVSGGEALPLTCDLIVDIFIENLRRFAAGEPLKNVVTAAGYAAE